MTIVHQTKEAGIVIVLEASDSGELTQKWNSRKAKHVHVDHFLCLSWDFGFFSSPNSSGAVHSLGLWVEWYEKFTEW